MRCRRANQISLVANRMDIRFILIEGKQTKHVRVSQQAEPNANETRTNRAAPTSDTQRGRATATTTTNQHNNNNNINDTRCISCDGPMPPVVMCLLCCL